MSNFYKFNNAKKFLLQYVAMKKYFFVKKYFNCIRGIKKVFKRLKNVNQIFRANNLKFFRDRRIITYRHNITII